jgi:hypothetical protein
MKASGDKRSRKPSKKPRTGKKSRRTTRKCLAVRRPTKRRPTPHNPKGGKPPGGKKPAPRPRKAKPGRGAKSLVDAVNTMLAEDSEEIARALGGEAKAGNISGLRLAVELANESKPASRDEPDPEILALNLPRPEDLEAEPQWVDPIPGAIWVGDHWVSPTDAGQDGDQGAEEQGPRERKGRDEGNKGTRGQGNRGTEDSGE